MIYYGSESLSSLTTRIWELMQNLIKNVKYLTELKKSNQNMNSQQISM